MVDIQLVDFRLFDLLLEIGFVILVAFIIFFLLTLVKKNIKLP